MKKKNLEKASPCVVSLYINYLFSNIKSVFRKKKNYPKEERSLSVTVSTHHLFEPEIMINRLCEEQIWELKEAFSLLDEDGDGMISAKELGVVMKFLNVSDPEQAELIKQMYVQRNQKIDFLTFVNLMSEKIVLDSEQEILAAFEVFDQDGNGFISPNEFLKTMVSMGLKVTEEEVDEMIHQADCDGDGQINYLEFLEMMASISVKM
mmetsp:Transcript_4629/g.6037  ORF Transcript_4629/g.6037 Transcript_4629/m.6037 type:complete len:207 (-) Transcript_4629:21-641(-)